MRLDKDKIEVLRRTLGISKQQLAKKSGLSRQGIYNILHTQNGNAKLETIEQLAGALGVKPMELMK